MYPLHWRKLLEHFLTATYRKNVTPVGVCAINVRTGDGYVGKHQHPGAREVLLEASYRAVLMELEGVISPLTSLLVVDGHCIAFLGIASSPENEKQYGAFLQATLDSRPLDYENRFRDNE